MIEKLSKNPYSVDKERDEIVDKINEAIDRVNQHDKELAFLKIVNT